jgi:hypothetical protein
MKKAVVPTVAAQLIPPSVFQSRNLRHGIAFVPASQAATTLRPGSQRPKKTAARAWRLKNASPRWIARARLERIAPLRASSFRSAARPIR